MKNNIAEIDILPERERERDLEDVGEVTARSIEEKREG